MATKDDSGGLADRRSMREIEEAAVGGKNAPLSARAQLKNSKRLKFLRDREKKRLKKLLEERRAKKQQKEGN
jgi:hypothetical protein